MTKEQLATIGRALYGEFWHRPMAAALGCSTRQVFRYGTGESKVPDMVMSRLYNQIRMKQMEVMDLIDLFYESEKERP